MIALKFLSPIFVGVKALAQLLSSSCGIIDSGYYPVKQQCSGRVP